MAIHYELTLAEIIGFIGGLVLAIALAPQVFHTLKTKSTKDISYGWQFIYISGLILNYIYFVMIRATAAWITLTVEVGFAIWLVILKIQYDGFGQPSGKSITKDGLSSILGPADSLFAGTEREIQDAEMGLPNVIIVEGNIELDIPLEALTYKDAIKFRLDSSIGANTLVSEAYRGFHIMIDVVFQIDLQADFGTVLLAKMCELARIHKVRVVHNHVEIFDGEVSPPGFAAFALLDESHMSAHCYSDQGKLVFDVFTCGADPDCTRRVARDVYGYLREHLGEDASYQIHRMHRFPLKLP